MQRDGTKIPGRRNFEYVMQPDGTKIPQEELACHTSRPDGTKDSLPEVESSIRWLTQEFSESSSGCCRHIWAESTRVLSSWPYSCFGNSCSCGQKASMSCFLVTRARTTIIDFLKNIYKDPVLTKWPLSWAYRCSTNNKYRTENYFDNYFLITGTDFKIFWMNHYYGYSFPRQPN